jgi:hypothetical protein
MLQEIKYFHPIIFVFYKMVNKKKKILVEDHKFPDFYPNTIVPNPLFKDFPKELKISELKVVQVKNKKKSKTKKFVQKNEPPVDYLNRFKKQIVKKRKTKTK